jgi:hypothetical protein
LQRVHRRTVCKDETGKEYNALEIFTHCIKYLKDHMLENINKKINGEIKVSDIDFVITVPAIWDDTAKMFMIAAADKVDPYICPYKLQCQPLTIINVYASLKCEIHQNGYGKSVFPTTSH